MCKPSVNMSKFESPAQFPVDNFSYEVMPNLEFVLCQFAEFAYMINAFISITS